YRLGNTRSSHKTLGNGGSCLLRSNHRNGGRSDRNESSGASGPDFKLLFDELSPSALRHFRDRRETDDRQSRIGLFTCSRTRAPTSRASQKGLSLCQLAQVLRCAR